MPRRNADRHDNGLLMLRAGDLERAYRPGETLNLRWTADERAGRPSSEAVELTARLAAPEATFIVGVAR